MSLQIVLQTIVSCAALQAASLSLARAHGGDAPQALSIVATDVRGPVIVKLNEGLAMRRPEGFRFVCPALWGEDEVVPTQSMPEGLTLVGASSGLYVLAEDGSALRHADPTAAGRVLALGASAHGVHALRVRESYELLDVRKEAVHALWQDSARWEDMAVAAGSITLMRIEAARLFELRLAADGSVVAQTNVEIPEAATHVRARSLGTTFYAVLLSSSLRAELGRIDQGRWLSLGSAGAIAGPIETKEGQRFAAFDGELVRFDNEQVSALSELAKVTCLGRQGDVSYACSAGDLRALTADGLGATLFALKDLLEPDREHLPEALRETCMLQWRRFTIDLLRVGIKPRSVASLPAMQETARDAGPSDDARDAEASGERSGAQAIAVEPELERDADEPAADPEASEPALPDEDAPPATSPTRAARRNARGSCALADAQSQRGSLIGFGTFVCLALIAAQRQRQKRPLTSRRRRALAARS